MKYLHLFRSPAPWNRLLAAASLLLALSACVHPEEVNYVQNLVLDQASAINKEYKIIIKKDDRLFISVSSKNPALAQMFNKDSGSVSSPRDDERGYFVKYGRRHRLSRSGKNQGGRQDVHPACRRH